MTYYVVDDWSGGLDRRRMPAVASPTTLFQIDNAHINPGGEIEKRKAFVSYANAVGTLGLAAVGQDIYVFGSQANPLPAGSPLTYQQLDPGGGGVIVTAIEDWDLFDGKLYVVARGSDSALYHFYDGTLVPGGLGRNIRTFEEKVYSVLGKDLSFSATGDPTDWSGVGSGTINLSTRDAESLDLEGLEIYYNQLAVLSPKAVQFWRMDPDPLNNQQLQVLRAAGTESGTAVKQYGGGDVLYLDSSGIRSLRARDSSNAASVSDIGSPIDEIMQELRRTIPDEYRRGIAAVEQGTGRFWLHIGGEIYVLSYFPGPKVTAWSRYIPNVPATHIVSYGLSLAIRGEDNNIYLYGGEDYNTYDTSEVMVITPFLHLSKPATSKEYVGLDVAGENVWAIDVNYRPSQLLSEEDYWSHVGVYDGVTHNLQAMGLSGVGSHVAFRLSCTKDGYARMASMALHYISREAR